MTDWSALGLSVYKIGGDGLALDQAERTAAVAIGTSAGAALPLETACVVTLLTGGPGARRRGRTYLGGFSIAAMSAVANERGKFTSSFVLAS